MEYKLIEVPSGALRHPDLPLTNVRSFRQLSGPSSLDATLKLTPELHATLPLLRPYHHAIWAVAGRRIVGGGIITSRASIADRLDLDCTGFSGALMQGTPWMGPDYNGVKVDPLDMVRRMYSHAQSFHNGNLGIRLDNTTSPIRIGEEEKEVSFTTSSGEHVDFEAGPYRLTWWARDDMGRAIDNLARDTPFDYLEQSTYSSTGISHRLRLGYPRLGARKPSIRAIIGINATAYPNLNDEEHSTAALFVGAGEGKKAIHAMAEGTKTTGLRRVATPTDKRIGSSRTAANRARAAIKSGRTLNFDTIALADHQLSPLGGIDPGDIIHVSGNTDAEKVSQWVRVLSIELDHTTHVQTLKVEPE